MSILGAILLKTCINGIKRAANPNKNPLIDSVIAVGGDVLGNALGDVLSDSEAWAEGFKFLAENIEWVDIL